MTDLPQPTLGDALRELSRALDDYDLSGLTTVRVHEDGALLLTVASDAFDAWAARFPDERRTTHHHDSGVTYHSTHGALMCGTALTIHAFEEAVAA